MEKFLMYFLFVVGVVLIVKGGDWFVDGAVWLAEITKIPKFIIGATIISVATTLPEIIVSTIAAIEGHSILVSGAANAVALSQSKVGMAIGNGIGSVICNTAMILAISVVFMPIGVKRNDFAPKAFLLLAAVAALFAFSLNGSLNIWGALVLVLIFALYIAENVRSAKQDATDRVKQNAQNASGSVGAEATTAENAPATDKKSIILNILRIVGGAAAIVIGSQLLVDKGGQIALSWGVSEAIIGVTIVAVGTSLPELVTAITSIIKKQSSMSVGNVIGANVIDTTLIPAVCSFVYGGNLPVSAQNVYLDFPVAVLVTLITAVPAVIRKKFSRVQGVLLLLIYAAYLVIITAGLNWYLGLFGVAA